MRKSGSIKLKIILIWVAFCFYACSLAQELSLLSLDLKDVELKDALKIIAQASGMNIITDKDVKASINISLKDIPWQTALDNILKTNELTYRIEGNTIRVMTLSTVKKEEETIPLATKIITLNFAKAEDLKTSLGKILSSRGSMEVNVPTNSLIVNDTPDILAKMEGLANKLDIRTPQVIIKALIMSLKLTETDKFGIDWTATHKKYDVGDINDTDNLQRKLRQVQQDLKPDSPVLALAYGKTILPEWLFNATVEFYAENKKATILAHPHILTLNNRDAQIELTEQVAYQSTSQTEQGSYTTTQFKDVGIKLYVTPQITKDRFISLSVKVEQSYVAGYSGTDNQPSIDSRKTETNFMLKDGETAVIGGLRKKDNTLTTHKTPILGDIPFLGKLFRKEVKETTDTELLVFITPNIAEESLMSLEEERKLNESKDKLLSESRKERDRVISRALAEQRQKEEQKELLRQKKAKELQQQIALEQKEKERQELKRKAKEKAGHKEKIEQEKQKQKQLAAEQKEQERRQKEQKRQEEMLQKKAERERIRQQKEQQRIQKNIEKKLAAEQRKKELTREKELRPQIASLYREAITYYKKSQFAQAINTFERILSLDPNQTKARKYLESKIPQKIEQLAR